MTIHRSVLRQSTPLRITRLRKCPSRSLASRPDFLGMLDGKARRTPSSQLLDAIRPAESSSNSPSSKSSDSTSSLSSILSGPSSSSSTSTSSPSTSSGTSSPHRSSFDVLSQMTRRMSPARSNAADTLMSKADTARKSRSIEQTVRRQWRTGDVYAPHDLSSEEHGKYQKGRTPRADAFDVLNLNPLDEYKNIPLMLDFVSQLGRLKHQRETGLRGVNQRKISKAVRRATALGLLPRTHPHPEMLRRPGPWQWK